MEYRKRFRDRDLLPRSLTLYFAHRDYGFAEACLNIERRVPWVSVERLIDECDLLDIRDKAQAILTAHNVPESQWAAEPPVVAYGERKNDDDCKGR